MTENQRLKILQNELKFKNQSAFAAGLGLTTGALSDILREKAKVGVSERVKRVLEHSYNINIAWLETGKGNIFKDNNHKSYLDDKIIPPMKLAEAPGKYNAVMLGEIELDGDETSPFIDIGDNQFIMVVPVVPIKAQAGYIRNYNDEQYIKENFTQKHSFTVTRVYRGRYMAFVVDGDSMDNGIAGEAIKEGDTVTGREIQKHHWRNKLHLHRYKDYVIVHKDGIFVKRIAEHDIDKGTITCHSLNPDKKYYPDFVLELDDCLQILNIVNVTQTR